MSYVVTFYTKATIPVQEFYKTKKEAIRIVSEEVKDYLIKIEKNS